MHSILNPGVNRIIIFTQKTLIERPDNLEWSNFTFVLAKSSTMKESLLVRIVRDIVSMIFVNLVYFFLSYGIEEFLEDSLSLS